MLTRRNLFRKGILPVLAYLLSNASTSWKWISDSWAQTRKLLPKGFPRDEVKDMHPAQIDNRNLEPDPLDQFGTMGPTDISIDSAHYRLRVVGEVNRPLSLTYEEILKLPSLTEKVLLICPGFFSNNGRWTGVHLKDLIELAHPKKEAMFLDIKGGRGKQLRIWLESLHRKKIFLAYRVNDEPLPQKHGFPLRLVIEGAYGEDWIKFVDEIVVSPWPLQGS